MTLTAFCVHILDYSARDYGVYFKYGKSDNVITSFISFSITIAVHISLSLKNFIMKSLDTKGAGKRIHVRSNRTLLEIATCCKILMVCSKVVRFLGKLNITGNQFIVMPL